VVTPTASSPAGRGRLGAVRDAAGAVVGAVLGVVPHLLHHVGLLAGAALVTGASGNLVFYVLGLGLSIPMLRRLYHRFRTPWAPAIAIVLFTALFALSTLVIGPAVSGTGGDPAPVEPTPTGGHAGHHG